MLYHRNPKTTTFDHVTYSTLNKPRLPVYYHRNLESQLDDLHHLKSFTPTYYDLKPALLCCILTTMSNSRFTKCGHPCFLEAELHAHADLDQQAVLILVAILAS